VGIGAGMAMAGLAIGPTTSPTIARMPSRLRMADRSFIFGASFNLCVVMQSQQKMQNAAKAVAPVRPRAPSAIRIVFIAKLLRR
jgi:hypothetical protein